MRESNRIQFQAGVTLVEAAILVALLSLVCLMAVANMGAFTTKPFCNAVAMDRPDGDWQNPAFFIEGQGQGSDLEPQCWVQWADQRYSGCGPWDDVWTCAN